MLYHDLVVYVKTLDPASVAANTSAEELFTVTGVTTQDIVLSVNKPTATAGVGIVGWRVSAANQVGITFMNSTAGALDPASESYTIVVGRASSATPADGDTM